MKNIKILPVIFILAVLHQSCKKDLTEVPYSTLSPSTIFVNETGLSQATLGIYQSWTATYFTQAHRYDNIFDICDRWALLEGGHRYQAPGVYGAGVMDPYTSLAFTPSTNQGAVTWQRLYLTISRANAVIANAAKAVADVNVSDSYKAEALFNRAYAYFHLVRLFGGVPLVTMEITSLAQRDQIFGARATAEEVYAQIISDLQFAEEKLPNTRPPAELGRVTAGTAKAMLGKVYLTMAGKPLQKTENYQKAVDKLKEVVDAAATYNFGLVDDFKSIFSTSNEMSKEVVLAFRYGWSTSLVDANINPFFFALDGIDPSGTQSQYGLTYSFFQLYEPQDVRRDFTVPAHFKDLKHSNGDSLFYDPATFHYINQTTGMPAFNAAIKYGVGYGKYSRDARPPGGLPWSYTDDLMDLRWSDVLLCYAEALNETNATAQALSYVNEVRTRSNATPYSLGDQEDLRQKIRKERKLELMGEGHTIFDIRRWGTLKEEMDAMSPDQVTNGALPAYNSKLELYPIPQVEINANPKLIQNPGW